MTDDAETTPVREAQVPDESNSPAGPPEFPASPVGVPGVSMREAQSRDVAPDEAPVTLTETKVQETVDQVEKTLELAQRLGMTDYSPRITGSALRQLIYGARMWRRTKREVDALRAQLTRYQDLADEENESDD